MRLDQKSARQLGNESNKQHGPRRSPDSHLDGDTLPLTELPSHSAVYGEGPAFLQVDLGTGFAPSVRSSGLALWSAPANRVLRSASIEEPQMT